MRKKLQLIVFIMLFFVMGCNNKQHNNNTSESEEVTSDDSTPWGYRNVMKASDYDFIVSAINGENTTIKIRTVGLKEEYKESFPIEGQVKDSFMADLNNDSLEEFYLVISPTDDSGNLQLLGFAINDSENISMIAIDVLKENRDMNTDSIELKNNKLFRHYQVNGITKNYQYELFSRKTGYLLKPIEQ
ncbi:hypothetical protein C7377_1015 [Balneicella halophila]|uniref:Lipoprotein n=1 Tax=Balneicella halophila TaxID=1537566 RepID=A0A7L4UQ29_BALHA|nr:hypothetical protein [Balneicella halophila]PVX50702.1 hypothetical protein C7377_1015 [Balneicella halophila]